MIYPTTLVNILDQLWVQMLNIIVIAAKRQERLAQYEHSCINIIKNKGVKIIATMQRSNKNIVRDNKVVERVSTYQQVESKLQVDYKKDNNNKQEIKNKEEDKITTKSLVEEQTKL